MFLIKNVVVYKHPTVLLVIYRVCTFVYLLLLHAASTEPIKVKFDIETGYSLD